MYGLLDIKKETISLFIIIEVGDFSGVLYVDFDPKVHTPTYFVSPWQDPRNDATTYAGLKDIREGTIIVFPSYTLHYVHPNSVRKPRVVMSFDMLPTLPRHQSVE